MMKDLALSALSDVDFILILPTVKKWFKKNWNQVCYSRILIGLRGLSSTPIDIIIITSNLADFT